MTSINSNYNSLYSSLAAYKPTIQGAVKDVGYRLERVAKATLCGSLVTTVFIGGSLYAKLPFIAATNVLSHTFFPLNHAISSKVCEKFRFSALTEACFSILGGVICTHLALEALGFSLCGPEVPVLLFTQAIFPAFIRRVSYELDRLDRSSFFKKSPVLHLDQQNFDSTIAKGPVIVDFSATWSAPCNMLAPIMEALSEELKDKVTVAKIDWDGFTASIVSRYKVKKFPTIILFKDGKELSRIVGFSEKSEIYSSLISILKINDN